MSTEQTPEELKAQIEKEAKHAANEHTGYEFGLTHTVFSNGYIAGATKYAEEAERLDAKLDVKHSFNVDLNQECDKKDARIKELEGLMRDFTMWCQYPDVAKNMDIVKASLFHRFKAALNSKSNG